MTLLLHFQSSSLSNHAAPALSSGIPVTEKEATENEEHERERERETLNLRILRD